MNIVILEDEKLTANNLVKILKSINPEINILHVFNSIGESISFLETNINIDLIFSDIELGDGLSFELFKKLDITTPIIFCTAYNKYAFEAFQTFGIDYVLKPFNKSSIEKALTKYEILKKKKENKSEIYEEILGILNQNLVPKNSNIIINSNDKIIPLPIHEIALFYIEDICTYALTFQQKKYLINTSLDKLEKENQPLFFRANKQILVNRKAIKDASHHFNRKVIVHLNFPFHIKIFVGKLKITSFVAWLTQN